jgi:chromosome segregation ATPase
MLEWEQSKEKLELEALKNKNKETLEKYQGRLKQKRTELNDELKEFETKKEKYQQYLDRFEKIEKDIKEAMKTAKKKKSRNQKKEGIN